MNQAQDSRQGKYQISVISEMFNIHPQTLRNYERTGLITPCRTEGNMRLYSEENIEELKRILTLSREMGVNLAGIEIITRLQRKIDMLQTEFQELLRFIQDEFYRENKELGDRFNARLTRSPFQSIVTVDRSSDAGATTK